MVDALNDIAGTISALRTTLKDQHAANDRLQAAVIEKDAAIARLLEQHAELLGHVRTASQLLAKPAELVFGRGTVAISIGKVDGAAMLLFEPLASADEPLPARGRRSPESIKIGSTRLVLEGQKGLDALMKAVELGYLELTGDYSPAHRLLRTCVEFIEDQRISCAEATCEDRVYENAPDFVAEIAGIVGFHKDPDAEDEDIES